MKKFLAAFVIVLMLTAIPVWAEACNTCGNKNHINLHNKYYSGGKGGTATGGSAAATAYGGVASAIANPTINNSVAPVQQSWMTATQSIATGAFTSNVATGPTNVTTGPTNVSVSGMGGSSGGGAESKVSGYVITQFPEPYVPIPAAPLTYQGPYDSSIFEDDQIWFNRPKWKKDMIENLPNGGKVVAAIYEKTEPVNYIQPREGKDFDKEKYYYLGNVYCKSAGPDDNPGTVWGGCARKLLEKGCTYAYKIAGAITYGARSKATNQSGGASIAGIFGQIFGFNAGAGASNTDHDASGYEIINLTWACVGMTPQQ